MQLTQEDVQKILDLVDKSNFSELHLQSGDLQLTLIKGGSPAAAEPKLVPPARLEAKKDVSEPETEIQPQITEEPNKIARINGEAAAACEEGTLVIKAPLIGTFYSRPEPGASPFVEVGTFVEEDSTVCLIETMKVFTSVKAGLQGYIEEICTADTQMVEYGQVMFRVRP